MPTTEGAELETDSDALFGAVRPNLLPLHAALESLSHGVLLLTSSRRIVFANRSARALLDSATVISGANGRLEFSIEAVGRQLDVSMLAMRTDAQPRALRLPGPAGAEVLAVCSAVDDGVYLLRVFQPRLARPLDCGLLRELYGLTVAESQVARHLFHGLGINEIASAMSVSRHTVRSHLRGIFAKCEVDSQSQLVLLLALGPHEA